MKEISVIEMDNVSGAYSWDFTNALSFLESAVNNAAELIGSATLGAVAGTVAGAVIGGSHGGDGGGILGFGIIGQGVGMLGGALIGGIACGIGGSLVGWDTTSKYSLELADGIINGTLV